MNRLPGPMHGSECSEVWIFDILCLGWWVVVLSHDTYCVILWYESSYLCSIRCSSVHNFLLYSWWRGGSLLHPYLLSQELIRFIKVMATSSPHGVRNLLSSLKLLVKPLFKIFLHSSCWILYKCTDGWLEYYLMMNFTHKGKWYSLNSWLE